MAADRSRSGCRIRRIPCRRIGTLKLISKPTFGLVIFRAKVGRILRIFLMGSFDASFPPSSASIERRGLLRPSTFEFLRLKGGELLRLLRSSFETSIVQTANSAGSPAPASNPGHVTLTARTRRSGRDIFASNSQATALSASSSAEGCASAAVRDSTRPSA